MKKGILFDMDGTLWDSARQVAESWNLAAAESGYSDCHLTTEDKMCIRDRYCRADGQCYGGPYGSRLHGRYLL